MNKDVPKVIIIILILIGLIFFLGSMTYKFTNNYEHKDYITTTASFVQPNDAGISDDGTHMYTLIYIYVVGEKEYYYETDFSTSIIPQIGSEIKIKYNPIVPSKAYSNSFSVFSIFQIIGVSFLFGALVILFSDLIWLRDLFIFLFTGGFIITCLINKFYTGGFIFAIIILGIMCFASIMDFISYIKKNKFQPLEDIKNEIEISKRIKQEKKEKKRNQTQADKEIKQKKMKRIKIGILLILAVPIDIFIEAHGWYPSETLYMIISIISALCFMVGFSIISLTLMGTFDNGKGTLYVAGKKIDNEDIRNRHNMTLKEKIIKFNIIGVFLRFLTVIGFVLISFLIAEIFHDFYYYNFENVVRAQIYSWITIAFIINLGYLFIKSHFSINKKIFLKFLLIFILCILATYCFSIQFEEKKETITSEEFKNIMTSYNFDLLDNR